METITSSNFSPLLQSPPSQQPPTPIHVHQTSPNTPPSKVEIISENNTIHSIIITCSCGNQTTIHCQY